MLHDQHSHTSYSGDSQASIKEYFMIADKYHTKYFVTTEHIEFDSVYNNQDWTVDFSSMKDELKELNNMYPNITPLLGVEIGYRSDHLADMERVINSEKFDVVNMSIHDNGKYDYYLKSTFNEIGIDNMLNIYFNNIINGLDNFHNFDVLSHFDYGFKTAYLVNNQIKISQYEDITRQIFRKLIKLNKTLEINLKVETVLGDQHLKTWLWWYYDEGGRKLTLSSDAHTKDSYDNYYNVQQRYIDIIKSLGFNNLIYYIKRKEYIFQL